MRACDECGKPIGPVRRSHPTPNQFEKRIDALIGALDELVTIYTEADEYVFQRRDRNRDTTGKITGIGKADPTGEVVADQEGNKQVLREVEATLRELDAIINGTKEKDWRDGLKSKLLTLYDPSHYSSLSAYRSSPRAEVRIRDRVMEALEAKRRRFARRLKEIDTDIRRAS